MNIQKYNDALLGDRGWVILPIDDADLLAGKIKNIHLASIKPMKIRGNHYHQNKTEYIFIFSGDVEVVIKDTVTNKIEKHDSIKCDTPYLLIAKPKFAHAIKNIGEKDVYLFCFGTKSYDSADPDVFSEKLIE
jgi:dTDP-4-dehydrorhamnose 3,5-epimerase-like enzyme